MDDFVFGTEGILFVMPIISFSYEISEIKLRVHNFISETYSRFRVIIQPNLFVFASNQIIILNGKIL